MKNTILVTDWLTNSDVFDFIDGCQTPVKDQLAKFDNASTGVGFIFVMGSITNTKDSSKDLDEIISYPVIKIMNKWYVILNDIGDITSAVIRAIAGDIENK